ncbi:MAG: phospho-N-acetylmuramoyl-pentapeptide-transferase [Spartobacteria bacterium]|nr:phospho-N-acetylmuramoyl-pentapeptide-transferase [Spartobacteria bacterium]
MLYYLHYLSELFSPLRVFRYITFRTLCASGTAFLICLILGPWMIKMLRILKYGQQVRQDEARPLLQFHGRKQGTPTMGGVLIIFSVFVSTLLWAVPTNGYVWLVLLTMIAMGAIGFRDDYLKIKKKQSKGLGAYSKLFFQTLWVLIVVSIMLMWPETSERMRTLMLPFMKNPVVTGMSAFAVFCFLWFVMVGATNAVNLTDGLDGLAIGCSNSVAVAYLVMTYVAGHTIFANYLQVPYVPQSGELAVLCGSLLGAGMGFLWYNSHPARVFMGDTGSLSLGGTIAMIAILINQEVVLVIVGLVFVLEALSVLIQVSYFKYSRMRYGQGRRVFRCAPLHHHFELLEKEQAEKEGRDVEVVETMITTRFWILSIICTLIGLATLKLR